MFTSPLASRYTGVLSELVLKVKLPAAEMEIVVKLKIPFGGKFKVTALVTINAPSAPVLPELNAWLKPCVAGKRQASTWTLKRLILFITDYLSQFVESLAIGAGLK